VFYVVMTDHKHLSCTWWSAYYFVAAQKFVVTTQNHTVWLYH